MSAETVTTKIEEKAKEAALEILAKAEEEALKVRDDILADAHAREDKIIGTAKQNAETIKKGIIQSAKLNSNLLLLSAKRDAMNNVKKEAKKKLLSFDDEKLLEFFIKEIKNSDLSGAFTLIPAKSFRSFSTANAQKIEKAADIKITVAENDADIEAGFVLSNDIYDVDFSIDAIIEEVFEKNEKAIYDTLFEGEE